MRNFFGAVKDVVENIKGGVVTIWAYIGDVRSTLLTSNSKFPIIYYSKQYKFLLVPFYDHYFDTVDKINYRCGLHFT